MLWPAIALLWSVHDVTGTHVPALSSCHGMSSDWQSGHGAAIATWIRSVVPLTDSDPLASPEVIAHFSDDLGLMEFLVENATANWFKESIAYDYVFTRYQGI